MSSTAGLRDAILAADDRPAVPVAVPEWGGVTVFVPTLAVDEIVGAGSQSMTDLCLLNISDGGGAKLFTAADLPALKKKSFKAVTRVLDVFIEHNGLGKDAKDTAKGN
jgi:hypothetical protein